MDEESGIQLCCQDPANLGELETPDPKKPEFTFRRCTVCGRRHFELVADPGVLGLRGGALG